MTSYISAIGYPISSDEIEKGLSDYSKKNASIYSEWITNKHLASLSNNLNY